MQPYLCYNKKPGSGKTTGIVISDILLILVLLKNGSDRR